jgi:hypothetical protein
MTCGCLLVLKAANDEHALEVVHVLRAIGDDDLSHLVHLRFVGFPQQSTDVGQILQRNSSIENPPLIPQAPLKGNIHWPKGLARPFMSLPCE